MKGGIKVIIFLGILILLILPLASAGFFSDFRAKITGELTQGSTALNITIGNTAQTITFVQVISPVIPNENGINSTTFNFTATDPDGVANLNDSSPQASFQLSGETTRLNTTCKLFADIDGTSANYSCTVDMYYFDKADASWTINVTIKDNNGAYNENTSATFQYNSLPALVISPTALAWTEFGVTATDQGSNNDPVLLNNTGNAEGLSINVTAFNLQGETTITQYIYTANFSIQNITASCSGTAPVNATSTNITSTVLQRGNNSLNYNNATSGQEEAFFCITAVNADLSAQSYSSAAYGSWLINIIT